MNGAKWTWAVAALWVWAQGALAQPAPTTRQAAPQERAVGEIIRDGGGELRINTTPCDGYSSVVVFREPYAREAAGEMNCKGRVRRLMRVQQR